MSDHSITNDKWVAARSILQTLLNAGHEAYFVGGYVRDCLLGEPVKDIDIATSALPDEVLALFPHTVATGLQHGTVSIIIAKVAYEVTTFRAESVYEQARRPKEVRFIRDLRADLERRDFTINAMALDSEERLIDPFAGQADLQLRLLRAVGDANERFAEDALRMLRCLRFAAQYELQIESHTWQALIANRSNLEHISIERVRMELDKMFEGRHPMRALALLCESGLFHHFRGLTDWDKLLTAWMQLAPNERPFALDPQLLQNAAGRWAHLFFTIAATPEQTVDICRKLTHSNQKTADIVDQLRFFHSLAACATSDNLERIWKTTTVEYSKQTALAVLEWLHNDWQGARLCPVSEQLVAHGERWLAQMSVFHTRDLAVNGNDLMKHLQRKNGPWLRALLTSLLRAAANADVANEEADLLELAERLVEAEDGGAQT